MYVVVHCVHVRVLPEERRIGPTTTQKVSFVGLVGETLPFQDFAHIMKISNRIT